MLEITQNEELERRLLTAFRYLSADRQDAVVATVEAEAPDCGRQPDRAADGDAERIALTRPA